MVFINCTNSIALLLFLSCFCPVFCTATDTITPTQFIKDPETIISNGNTFKLGFFSPAGGSRNRYVGIWYADISVTTVIWVANRDKPLKDSSGIVTISDGNLLVLNGKREVLWSSNVSDILTNSSHAQILDSGNLVLKENNSNGRIIWESFEHLSDSFLPKMKLSTDVRTDEKIYLTSWKSPPNPSTGSFSAGMDGLGIPQFFIWNGSRPYWRTGPWNGLKFIGVPTMSSSYLEGFSVLYDKEGTVSITFGLGNGSILLKLFLNSEGALVQTGWDYGKEDWRVEWLAPETDCQVYGNCGAFGTCSDNSSICRCLRGFEPKYIEEWSRGNWTNGCVRRTPLQCERKNNTGGEVGKEDGFLKLKMIKVPDSAEWLSALEDDCKNLCLNNCSCVAYAYDTGIGCMKWSGNLIDIQEFSRGGMDLYIRAAYSELDKKRDMKVVITITVIIGTFTIAICTCFSWRWMAKQRGRKEKMKEMLLSDIGEPDNINQVKLQELPLFNFEKLAIATNNFNASNKLGQGGFGPVYRGKLLDGHEIAVKRLSRASGQGLEEFMNEVVVISKLQHRNLVRLLGCCVEGEEKMLIYEFMPNKSLDTFLFDPLKQELLDWRKRFNIIEGIGRGLLYLHRDSRLRIIHRDLKASNILLDEALNPKISDFGTARIFGGNQDQANTIRVVGTYGYMSPEYAMEGRFSEKSDVFSFGVLILEIVSGRRNTSFDHDEQSLSLLGFAWKLWNEYNIIALIDPGVSGPHFLEEILRCIHVGLLCVQEFAKDRPTVSTIISMLNSEIADLPIPKQPAFTERRNFRDTNSSEQGQKGCSMNNVTVTIIEGR